MHHMPIHEPTKDDLETKGSTIHWAREYDIFTNLFGLGTDSKNSKLIGEIAGIKEGDRVLDVGCGNGHLSMAASKKAGKDGEVFGIDAAIEMIEVARKKSACNGDNIHFDIGLVENIPYPASSFDIVLNRLMIHHLPDDLKRRGIIEMYRVLKAGGTLCIADFVPPKKGPFTHIRHGRIIEGIEQIPFEEYPGLLAEAGFKDIHTEKTNTSLIDCLLGSKPK